jgi:WD40 repeat protein
LLTGSFDSEARLWDVQTSKVIHRLGHLASVNSVTFTPDGSRMLTASDDRTARVWDTTTGRPINNPLPHQSGVVSVRSNAAGTLALTCSFDSTARVWDLAAGIPSGPPIHHQGSVNVALWNRAEDRVLTAGAEGVGRLWAAPTSESHARLGVQGTDMLLAVSPDSRRLVAGRDDNTVRAFDLQSMKPVGTPIKIGVPAHALAVSEKNGVLVGSEGRIQHFDIESGRTVSSDVPLPRTEHIMAFSPDRKWVVTGNRSGTAQVRDASSGSSVGKTVEYRDFLTALAFSLDGRRIMTHGVRRHFRQWDAMTGDPRPSPDASAGFLCAVFHPDNRQIITAAQDLSVRSWGRETGKLNRSLLRDVPFTDNLVISPDGQTLLTAGGNRAQFWDLSTGKALGPALQQRRTIVYVAVSPDNRYFLTSSPEEIRRWTNPTPVVGSAQDLRMRTEVTSGMELLEDGSFRALDLAGWQERRGRLKTNP